MSRNSPPDPSPVKPVDCNLTEHKVDEIFHGLDQSGDGIIDLKELMVALKDCNVSKAHAAKIFDKYDTDKSGSISRDEFQRFVRERQENLRITFDHFDRDGTGRVRPSEIKETFKDLGIDLTQAEVDSLVYRLDKDATSTISWEEWREFFLLHPASSDLKDFANYWRHSNTIDIGDPAIVPDDFTDQEKASGVWMKTLAAGGFAGAVSRTSTAPVDRLKIYMQVYGRSNKTIAQYIRQLVGEGGVRGMWRGNFVNVVKIVPESAIKFGAYEQLKVYVKDLRGHETLTPLDRFISGSTAGMLAQSIIYPMEVVKTRLVLGKTGEYRSIGHCFWHVYKREGLRAMYRGFVPNLIGVIPYAGTDLAVYETLKSYWMKRNGPDTPIWVMVCCGAASSTCGQVCSYPFAVVRTRMQANTAVGTARDSPLTLARNILHHEGVRGLYRGLVPNFMKVVPAVSITYVIYEQARKVLGIQPNASS